MNIIFVHESFTRAIVRYKNETTVSTIATIMIPKGEANNDGKALLFAQTHSFPVLTLIEVLEIADRMTIIERNWLVEQPTIIDDDNVHLIEEL